MKSLFREMEGSYALTGAGGLRSAFVPLEDPFAGERPEVRVPGSEVASEPAAAAGFAE